MSEVIAVFKDDISPGAHLIEVGDYKDGLVTLIVGGYDRETILEYKPETALKLAEAITDLSQRIIQRRIDNGASTTR